MSDKNETIKCPVCGHENARYIDKCIICDFSLATFREKLQSRLSPEGTQTVEKVNLPKALGPLPSSNMLADKRNSKKDVMQCPECGKNNVVGAFLCHDCGAKLIEHTTLSELAKLAEKDTRETVAVSIQEIDKIFETADEIPIYNPKNQPATVVPKALDVPPESGVPDGCVKFMNWMLLRLEVEGANNAHITIHPKEGDPLLIGRQDDSLKVQPHIDLTEFLTETHGVSRRHALIHLRGSRLELQDLNSTNGTYINDVRFAPEEIHQLRHQDIITIGQVVIKVTFVKSPLWATDGLTERLDAEE